MTWLPVDPQGPVHSYEGGSLHEGAWLRGKWTWNSAHVELRVPREGGFSHFAPSAIWIASISGFLVGSFFHMMNWASGLG